MASTSSKPSGARKCTKLANKDKPAELFRTDFISSMKIPETETIDAKELSKFADPWRHEWNCGVQVPINEDEKPKSALVIRVDGVKVQPVEEKSNSSSDSDSQYDMDSLDIRWLQLLNEELTNLGLPPVTERLFELAMQHLELAVHGKPAPIEANASAPSEDDDLICDVCMSPHGEDGNDIVFCDNCNVGVHQMCYGVHRIPKGSWYCRPCSLGVRPRCVLCPNKGGAMKSTRNCDKWIHVSCALWIPEVIFENAETMEPATNLDKVPENRWNLRCTLCTNRSGACIQCNYRACRAAFHVTCAQKHGLQLISMPSFESYCLKHSDPARNVPSPPRKSATNHPSNAKPQEWLINLKPYFLRSLLNVHQYTASSIFYYWRLKKLSHFGQPLIRLDDSDKMIRRQQEEALWRRIQMLMFLRQNMEKARNLCYMVEKREKYKRQLYNTALDHVRRINELAEAGDSEVCRKSNGMEIRVRCNSNSLDDEKDTSLLKSFTRSRVKSPDGGSVVVNASLKRNGTVLTNADSVKRVRRPISHYSP